MLLEWVIVIIARIITYNEKGLIYKNVQGRVNRDILPANLAMQIDPTNIVIAHIKKE